MVSKNSTTCIGELYELVKQNNFTSFSELRLMFPNADQVGKLTVFNVGGNKVRLVAAVHYNRRKVYIRAVLTHSDYDQNRWRK
ncbi:type II toxin-antitoxin system HigB family toxin [Candidatus Contendibacter odensensis]|uniref:Type II toxin-antitoxin system HigB family toxin n=1 Tax=Candidatus Contendobacter odensis Run_B_J11 TaxID=1400861 RepID=A0A7U7GCE0_9GAMM|nr:type II toxin-antitoxin system HigB family toxin [Candidatus Contendobacter odensis]CDH45760.1 conserved hypothetical protein [Candidatus Contendobacter odensis Run_B_J11]